MMPEADKLDEAVYPSTDDLDRELDVQERAPEMVELYAQSLRDIVEGESVKGAGLEIRNDIVLIDIGYKSEGTIPQREFQTPSGELTIKVGDAIEVYLEQKEDSD